MAQRHSEHERAPTPRIQQLLTLTVHAEPMTTQFDEATVITQVSERLQERFPETSPAHITELVVAEVSALAERPVSDYIAVLAERAVKKRLKGERS